MLFPNCGPLPQISQVCAMNAPFKTAVYENSILSHDDAAGQLRLRYPVAGELFSITTESSDEVGIEESAHCVRDHDAVRKCRERTLALCM
jgi:hypothetical protein